jgi:hypothetical protein
MRRLWLLPLLAALAGCPPVDPDDGTGLVRLGPEGKTFTRFGATVIVPKNAVAQEVFIRVDVIDDDRFFPTLPGRVRIGPGYYFSPETIELREPITITLPYLEERVPSAALDPGTFDMRRVRNDEPQRALALPIVIPPTVTARSDRLGLFWATSPEKPVGSKLELSPAEAFLRVGDTQQFTARVFDASGNELADAELTWTVAPPRAASIDEEGLLTALGPGTVRLTVRSGTASANATVYIRGDSVGPSTFVHENPFPTGNDLFGGGLHASGAFVVGANGTFLSRTGETTWTRLFSTPGVVLHAAAGELSTGAVAVGLSGGNGVVVEVKEGASPKFTSFNTVQPRALWFDGTFGMAVGTGNDVLVRRGGAWVTEYSPSVEQLLSVIGDGQGGFTTVGSRGSLYRFDSATQTWNSLFQTQLNVLLTAAVLTQADGAGTWAVGGNRLWRFTGGGWTAHNLPQSPTLDAITALAAAEPDAVVLAGRVGQSGRLLRYRPSDDTWTSQGLRATQVIRGLFGQDGTCYAVGDLGAVWTYQEGAFTELSSGFYGDVADVWSAGNFVVAAVNECVGTGCTAREGKVVYRDLFGRWVELGTQPFLAPVRAVAARSATEVYAASGAQIFRYDGANWGLVPINGATGQTLTDLTLCGERLWAVGLGGTNYVGVETLERGGAYGTTHLFAVHCPTPEEVWVAGEGAIFQNARVVRSSSVRQGPWRAVWSPGVNEGLAFGDARYGLYWDSVDYRVHDAPGGLLPDIFHAMWGSSLDNLYLVGYTVTPLATGYAVRFDGVQWHLIDAGTQRRATAVHGSSAQEVWIGTASGGILRGVVP